MAKNFRERRGMGEKVILEMKPIAIAQIQFRFRNSEVADLCP